MPTQLEFAIFQAEGFQEGLCISRLGVSQCLFLKGNLQIMACIHHPRVPQTEQHFCLWKMGANFPPHTYRNSHSVSYLEIILTPRAGSMLEGQGTPSSCPPEGSVLAPPFQPTQLGILFHLPVNPPNVYAPHCQHTLSLAVLGSVGGTALQRGWRESGCKGSNSESPRAAIDPETRGGAVAAGCAVCAAGRSLSLIRIPPSSPV